MVWSGFTCLRIRTDGGLLCACNELLGFVKAGRISKMSVGYYQLPKKDAAP